MDIFRDASGLTFTVDDVKRRFIESAMAGGLERDHATMVFALALAGDVCSRELVSESCGVVFL